ncbi:MAG TPA: hypothetical protein VFA29_11355 [Candidatus Baltobacteraceae bacterium]|nr:hypothetical protein [Candidatus Baltobacteraceae bacterium]
MTPAAVASIAVLLLAACAPPHPAANNVAALPTNAVLPTPLVLPGDAPPQILAVQLSDPVFHSGETVSGTVVTSTNVADVRVQFAGHSGSIPQRGPGLFALSYTLPNIPFFLRGAYTATIFARNAAGLTATRDISVTIK